jgi:hypothetical protein
MYIIRTVVIGPVETVEYSLRCTKISHFLVCLVEDNESDKEGKTALTCNLHIFPMPCERAPVEDMANRF